jgi:hypothetical protein
MKNILIGGLLLFTLMVNSQTKLIAHKSNSEDKTEFNAGDYSDNYGLGEIYFPVISVKLLKNNCVVETRDNFQIDTICNHYYFNGTYTSEQIKTFYPEGTKFIGFDKVFKEDKPILIKKNSIFFLFTLIILGSGLFYTLKPKK